MQVTIRSDWTATFACHDASCAPPPAGTGGSRGKTVKVALKSKKGGMPDWADDDLEKQLVTALHSLNASKYIAKMGPRGEGEELFTYQSRVLDGLPPVIKHALISRIREKVAPVPFVEEGLHRFLSERGLPIPQVDFHTVEADLDKAGRIVEAIKATPRDDNNPHYKAAYDDFKGQSQEMWDFATKPVSEGGMGMTFTVWDERVTGKNDPYDSAQAQADDVANNRHMYVNRGGFFIGNNPDTPTGTNHPHMAEDEYFRFRAVHDLFGHVAVGTGFDRHGEYGAWMLHDSMYTGEGRKAMSTEYHGVNTHLWYTGKPMPQNHWGIILPDSVIQTVYDSEGRVVRK